jgi:diadenosine tetraphosphate (Ap4A) HIT family hydrolase
MTNFELHPQLQTDCFCLGQRGEMTVLLHRSALVPWFILVPATTVIELHDLPPPLRAALHHCADQLGRFVLAYFACEKLNVAAIGNVVPQLHLHVVGRRSDDALWPRVVWGNVADAAQHPAPAVAAIATALRAQGCLD